MAIGRYAITGAHGGLRRYAADLCDYHAKIKKHFSREVKELKGKPAADAKCDDCRPTPGPTVLDRVIAETDAKERTSEPIPVKVLPGQRRLF